MSSMTAVAFRKHMEFWTLPFCIRLVDASNKYLPTKSDFLREKLILRLKYIDLDCVHSTL